MGEVRALRLATRGSPLALFQAGLVRDLLFARAGLEVETVVVSTSGDRLADLPLSTIAGQGAFVKEVSLAVLDGRADLAVHSAKDLPTAAQAGLVLAAVPRRDDPRDALVGCRLSELGPGALVATGSVRRRAQVAWLRPDLTFCELRGNIAGRVERARRAGAGVLAMAALSRLGLEREAAEVLEPQVMLPQVGQGAIAVECREDDERVRDLLRALDDERAHTELLAERAFLSTLGSGCSLPCGALASSRGGGVTLEAMIASRDGHVVLRRGATGQEPNSLGRALATQLLEEAGGESLYDFGPAATGRQSRVEASGVR